MSVNRSFTIRAVFSGSNDNTSKSGILGTGILFIFGCCFKTIRFAYAPKNTQPCATKVSLVVVNISLSTFVKLFNSSLLVLLFVLLTIDRVFDIELFLVLSLVFTIVFLVPY